MEIFRRWGVLVGVGIGIMGLSYGIVGVFCLFGRI